MCYIDRSYPVSATDYKRGVSAMFLARELELRYAAAWLIGHKLRHALRQLPEPALARLVEVDESYCRGRGKPESQSDHPAPYFRRNASNFKRSKCRCPGAESTREFWRLGTDQCRDIAQDALHKVELESF